MLLFYIRYSIKFNHFLRVELVYAWMHPSSSHRFNGSNGFQTTCCTKAVSYHGLGCIYFDPRWVLKDLLDGIHLRQITSKGGCGMSIDIVDLLWCHTSIFETLLNA